MPKWIAIRASAAVALAGSAAILVVSGSIAALLLLSPVRNSGPFPPNLIKAGGCVMAALFGGAAVWGICAGVGVFRRRNWARISMVIFGAALAFFGGMGALAMALVPFPMDAAADQRVAAIARASMVGLYLILAAVGVWWLIVFNRQSAKRYFAETGAAAESARPLSVAIIGWYLTIGAAGTALCGVFRIPTILFGFVVAGWTTLAVCTALTAIQLYLGAGLLQLDEKARVGAIGYLCLMGANGVAMFAAPGYAGRMRTFAAAFHQYSHMDMPLMPSLWLFGIGNAAFFAIPIWFLVRRRAAFAAAARRES